MVPNYQSLWYNYDEPEKRLSFWQASEEIIPDELKEKLQLSVVPTFLIYSNGELKCHIKGARYTDIVKGIDDFIPEGPDD